MKKLFYIIFILFLTIISAIILQYDSKIIIYFLDYEITTNTRIIFLFLFSLLILIFCFFSIINVLLRSNKKKFTKKTEKEIKKYKNYIENITEAIIFNISNNSKKANEKLKIADKYIKNDLTNLVKSQILFNNQKYQDSIAIISNLSCKNTKNIKNQICNNLLLYNVYLLNALENKNNKKIKFYANKILKIQPKDERCLKLLYKVYKEENNWEICLEILLKIKKFIKDYEYKKELFLIKENLAKYYFENLNYEKSLKYSLEVFKNDKNLYSNNKILILSLDKIKPTKTKKYIKKIWKYTPKIIFGDLYLKNTNLSKRIKLAKQLYNINKNNINSVLFYSNILVESNKIEFVDDNMRNILNNCSYKEAYKILIKIEEKNSSNSSLINVFKEKIANAKSIDYE